jgi:predicted 3-demethylubiquinone-9 3-methyltransferase (glyoxalase superfamily)
MQKITPNLWFDHNAQEAVDYYLSVFPDSKIISYLHYPKEGLADFQREFAGEILTIEFELMGQRFVAINAGDNFKFNEAVSFMVECKDQEEIDYYWDRLSAFPESEQCGWCKDKYGLSWQIAPKVIDDLMTNPKMFQKFMEMKKIVIAELDDI